MPYIIIDTQYSLSVYKRLMTYFNVTHGLLPTQITKHITILFLPALIKNLQH